MEQSLAVAGKVVDWVHVGKGEAEPLTAHLLCVVSFGLGNTSGRFFNTTHTAAQLPHKRPPTPLPLAC